MQAILGTRLSADINLIAQILMLTALWIGFYFAHKHKIRPHHANIQTTVVIVNLFFIFFIMVTSFYNFVILGGTTSGTIAYLMMFHALLGLIAEISGIYLVLRMRTQLIPPRFKVKNFKLQMRLTLTLWTFVVLLGFGIYYFRYLAPKTVIQSPIAPLQHDADTLQIHADELQAAASRNNLATAHRHAEHIINLIAGKNSADYGDLDGDGFIEDPGDGTGTLVFLKQVHDQSTAGGGSGASAAQVADQVRDELVQVLADAKTVLQTKDLAAAAPQVAEILTLSNQINKGTVKSIPQIAQFLNASTAQPTIQAGAAPSGTTTINMKDFEFQPNAITVPKGTTVVFVNQDNAKHTATSDDGSFNSKDMSGGQTFSFTFDQPGVYAYHCEFHGDKGGVDMAGTITVQ